MRILATASVGSHLETIYAIENALRADNTNLEVVIADIMGFRGWDATRIPFRGQAKRMHFSPAYCGLPNGPVTSRTWKLVKQGALRFLKATDPDLYLIMDDSWYELCKVALLQGAKVLDFPILMVQEGPFSRRVVHVRKQRFISRVRTSTRKMLNHLKDLSNKPLLPRQRFISRVRTSTRKMLNHLKDLSNKPLLPRHGGWGEDRLAVASPYYAFLFKEAGVSDERIVVTGIPRYDVLLQTRKIWSQKRERRHRFSSQINVLLLSQPFVRYKDFHVGEYAELWRVVAGGLKLLADSIPLNLTIRLHPSETIEDIEPLMAELRQPFAIQYADQPLTVILSEFDLVIGFCSSGLLEALTVGIPTVCVESATLSSKTVWFRKASVPVATSAQELGTLCKNAIEIGSGEVDLRMLTDETGQIDGKASERVAVLCQALVHEML